MIRLDKVAIAQGGNTLLRDATWHLRPGAKVGIVGRNGSGKTTLLRALAGELTVEHGSLQRRGRARIGYLPQAAVAGSTETVWDEAANAMTHLQKLADELAAAERALEADRPGALERVDAATEAWRLAGGPTKDQTVGSVLHGLGFTPGAWAQACDTLSGGWQMRVALARVLLAQPDVALLDEPTNHLDITARSWLAKHLAAAKYAVVVVSHDRHLLDKAVTEVVALSHQTLETFKGNYSRYLAEKAARQLTAQRSFDKQQSEIKHMEHFIERFGAKATKAAAARSRKKALDRMDRVHAPQTEASGPRLRLPEAPPSAQEVITLTDVSAGWDDGPDVLRGVDLCLTRGMRLAVLGANGTGKSTLLKVMSGTLRPRKGRRRLGDRVRMGVFSQDLASSLDGERSAFELVGQAAPLAAPQQIRSILGALGLSGDSAMRPAAGLSGGERARAALAVFVAKPCNALLLDEPTNHLDVDTVDVLAAAVAAFEGAVLLVTHDRYLVESVATHVLRLGEPGVMVLEEGVRPQHFDLLSTATTGRPAEEASGEGGASYADRKQAARALQRDRRRLNKVEREIAKLEERTSALDDALVEAATDFDRVKALAEEQREAAESLEALYAEWETLATKLE